jgi:D-glycero-alpha-D-manno-heptose 1-phosphate guanylyltransferase
MIHEVIVLAGGFGTRLQSVVSELPKPMAPVAGKPFLQYILDYLSAQGMQRCILAVGHLRHTIMEHFGSEYNGLQLVYSEEIEPLGTGGGIKQACEMLQGNNAFVLNGDTFFDVDLAALYNHHTKTGAQLTLALKTMYDFDRYGTVELNEEGIITGFLEKQHLAQGLINGGVYCLNTSVFGQHLPKVFSFEKEVLEVQYRQGRIAGIEFDGYFIDIGIPEDYAKAQVDFAGKSPDYDQSWTLFLDRDGVLNRKIDDDYVRQWSDFEFLPGVKESLVTLSSIFGRIVITTNQRGVGRGLFSLSDLDLIHQQMLSDIQKAGGRVDGIFVCPHLADDPTCNCRKPKPGLALRACAIFPEIDLNRSVMVGDSMSDIGFGAGLGMHTVQVGNQDAADADEHYTSLAEWVDSIVRFS